MKKIFTLAAAAAVAALTGCVAYPVAYAPPARPGSVGVAVTAPSFPVLAYADMAPPPPIYEPVYAAPFPGGIWIGGYWGWSGGRHEWVPGRWEHPRPGYEWHPHHWEQAGGRWQLHGGGWARR